MTSRNRVALITGDGIGTGVLPPARRVLDAVGRRHGIDHSRDLDEIIICLEAGYTSVMVDGSHLPFAELRRAYLEAVRVTLPSALPGSDAVSLRAAGRNAVRDATLEVIGRLSPRAEEGNP
jgi:isocitrate/isopropylmalate dehydrogenase